MNATLKWRTVFQVVFLCFGILKASEVIWLNQMIIDIILRLYKNKTNGISSTEHFVYILCIWLPEKYVYLPQQSRWLSPYILDENTIARFKCKWFADRKRIVIQRNGYSHFLSVSKQSKVQISTMTLSCRGCELIETIGWSSKNPCSTVVRIPNIFYNFFKLDSGFTRNRTIVWSN